MSLVEVGLGGLWCAGVEGVDSCGEDKSGDLWETGGLCRMGGLGEGGGGGGDL